MTDAGLAELPMLRPDWQKPSSRRAQIDWGWAQHAGQRVGDPISDAAKRSVRNLKRQLAPMSDAVVDVFEGNAWREAAGDVFWKGSAVGRTRALAKIRKLFPAPVEIRRLGPLGPTIFIRWLEPHDAILLDHSDPGMRQAGIVSRAFALVGSVRGRVLPISLIGAEFSDHSLGRLAQRASFAEPVGVLSAAAEGFLGMDVDEALARGRGSLVLSGGDAGAFLAHVVYGKSPDGRWRIFSHVRTFVAASQVKADQVPVMPAQSVGKSVLVSGLSLMSRRELPGVESPLSAETLAELERDLDEQKKECHYG